MLTSVGENGISFYNYQKSTNSSGFVLWWGFLLVFCALVCSFSICDWEIHILNVSANLLCKLCNIDMNLWLLWNKFMICTGIIQWESSALIWLHDISCRNFTLNGRRVCKCHTNDTYPTVIIYTYLIQRKKTVQNFYIFHLCILGADSLVLGSFQKTQLVQRWRQQNYPRHALLH